MKQSDSADKTNYGSSADVTAKSPMPFNEEARLLRNEKPQSTNVISSPDDMDDILDALYDLSPLGMYIMNTSSISCGDNAYLGCNFIFSANSMDIVSKGEGIFMSPPILMCCGPNKEFKNLLQIIMTDGEVRYYKPAEPALNYPHGAEEHLIADDELADYGVSLEKSDDSLLLAGSEEQHYPDAL